MKRRGIILSLIFCLSIMLPQTSQAESIALTSGILFAAATNDLEPGFLLRGNDFFISGGAQTPVPNFFTPSPVIGQAYAMNVTIPIISDPRFCEFCHFYFFLGSGGGPDTLLMLHGQTFQQVLTLPPSPFLYSGTFHLAAAFPAFTSGVNVGLFFMSGDLTGPFGNLTLNGGGTVTTLGAQNGFVRYDFGPVPEPSTGLFLAFGLGVLALWRLGAKGLSNEDLAGITRRLIEI